MNEAQENEPTFAAARSTVVETDSPRAADGDRSITPGLLTVNDCALSVSANSLYFHRVDQRQRSIIFDHVHT